MGIPVFQSVRSQTPPLTANSRDLPYTVLAGRHLNAKDRRRKQSFLAFGDLGTAAGRTGGARVLWFKLGDRRRKRPLCRAFGETLGCHTIAKAGVSVRDRPRPAPRVSNTFNCATFF